MARRLTRRGALGAGIGAALAAPAALDAIARGGAAAAMQAGSRRPRLRPPEALRSRRGELDVRLVCRRATVDLGGPQPARTYTYDGTVPGRTWEVRAGDVLKVDLRNHLGPMPEGVPLRMDRPHEWTTTNLHTHGLHVSPRGNGDNVFLSIPPGERQRYEIPIPDDHPAGLFWYHPHRHGAVTQQVRAGMAGLIVVRGDVDEVPEIRAAREQLMVLQAIELGPDGELLDPIPEPTKEQAFFPRSQVLYTVNGTQRPVITMHPGEVQRWRMLNAAEGKFMSLRLEEHDVHVAAWDGLTLPAPEQTDVVMLAAGNRADVLVQAGRPGRYELVLTPGSSQRPNIPGMPPSAGDHGDHAGAAPGSLNVSEELRPRSIATLVVRGDGPRMRLPGSLPAFAPRMLPIARERRFAFTVERDPDDEFLSFGIDGRPFDHHRRPYEVRLGTAERWTLVNDLDRKLADHAHAYHIHVNPMRIVEINGRRLPTPQWRDTVTLSGRTGDSVTFESNFVDFTGTFVEHCHVLSHEDLGMMSAVRVVR